MQTILDAISRPNSSKQIKANDLPSTILYNITPPWIRKFWTRRIDVFTVYRNRNYFWQWFRSTTNSKRRQVTRKG
jgi:hypothetical protein